MKILAISGSLREASTNTAILKNLQKLVPANVEFEIYFQAGELPHFSPDIDTEKAFEPVKTLRNLIKKSDAVIICTPEYAFGVPGSLKNALDWLVSSGELNEKPVAAISASPMYSGGDKALASLDLTLTALGTVNAGRLSIPNIKNKLNEAREITDLETQDALKTLLFELEKVVVNIGK
jgi:NAD(P)H-dependent FMN reductase